MKRYKYIYATHMREPFAKISKVEVVSETSKFLTFIGMHGVEKRRKKGSTISVHDTFEDAKESLLYWCDKRINNHKEKLEQAEITRRRVEELSQ